MTLMPMIMIMNICKENLTLQKGLKQMCTPLHNKENRRTAKHSKGWSS